MLKFFGMRIHMGLANAPAYTLYWSQDLGCSAIADIKSVKRFTCSWQLSIQLREDDKLFKIRPLIETIRNERIKVDPEEYQSVDGEIIPS